MSRLRFVLICILFAGVLLLIWFNGDECLELVQRQNYPSLAGEQQSPRDFSDYANDSSLFDENKIGRAHVRTPVTSLSRMPSSA